MRTETRTVQIGEYLGPIDWSYDFAAWGWDRGGSGNPTIVPESVETLKTVEAGLARGETWTVVEHGNRREVIQVGMYDGWPYWTPTPFYFLRSSLGGGEWSSWFGPHSPARVGGDG